MGAAVEATEPPAGATGRPSRTGADVVAVALLALLAVVPIAATFLRAAPDWVPTGDSAAIVVRADDVLTSRTPLLGMPSTVGTSTGEETSHPGPSELWAIAAVGALVDETWAPALAVALVHVAAAAAAVLAGRRAARLRGAALAAAGVAVVGWSLQGPFLFDPFNPYAGVLPLGAFLAAAVVAVTRDVRWLAVAAGFGSYAAHSHLTYVPMVVAVAVAVVVAGVRGPWRDARPRDVRQAAVATAAVGIAFWWPAVVDQVAGSGNLGAMLGASGSGGERAGWDLAVRAVVNGLGRPVWLDPGADVTHLVLPVGAREVLVTAATAAALAVAWARSAAGSTVRVASALTLVAAVAGMATLALVPDYVWNVLAMHNYLWLWIVGSGAAGTVAARLAQAVPATVAVRAAAAVAAVAATATVVAGPSRPLEPSWAASVRRLGPELAGVLRCDRTYVIGTEMDYAPGGVAAGLYLVLRDAGFDVWADESRRRSFGSHRVIDTSEADALLDIRVAEPEAPEEVTAVVDADGVRHAVLLHPTGDRQRDLLVDDGRSTSCP